MTAFRRAISLGAALALSCASTASAGLPSVDAGGGVISQGVAPEAGVGGTFVDQFAHLEAGQRIPRTGRESFNLDLHSLGEGSENQLFQWSFGGVVHAACGGLFDTESVSDQSEHNLPDTRMTGPRIDVFEISPDDTHASAQLQGFAYSSSCRDTIPYLVSAQFVINGQRQIAFGPCRGCVWTYNESRDVVEPSAVTFSWCPDELPSETNPYSCGGSGIATPFDLVKYGRIGKRVAIDP